MAKDAPAERFTRIRIAEGVRLFADPTDKYKTVTVAAYIRLPLDRDAAKNALVQQVLTRASRRFPTKKSMDNYLANLYGATFSTEIMKAGESQVLAFSINCLQNRYAPAGEDLLTLGIHFLADKLFYPLVERGAFSEKIVAQEKDNLLNALASLMNDKEKYAFGRCVEKMCAREPFRLSELGRPAAVRRASAKSLYAHYLRLVGGAQVDFYAVGEMEPKTLARILAGFLPVRSKIRAIPKAAARKAPPQPRELREKADIAQSKLIMGFRTGATYASRGFESLEVFNALFGSLANLGSRLLTVLRQKEGLCYSVESTIEGGKGLLFVNSGIAGENYAKAKKLVIQELDEIRAGRFSRRELASAKTALANSIRTAADSPSSIIKDHYLSLVAGKAISPMDRLGLINAVSKESVAAAAKKVKLDTVYFLEGS